MIRPAHPDFIRDCATVAREGAAGYVPAGSPSTFCVLVPRCGGGLVQVTGLRFDEPDRSIRRILQGAHR